MPSSPLTRDDAVRHRARSGRASFIGLLMALALSACTTGSPETTGTVRPSHTVTPAASAQTSAPTVAASPTAKEAGTPTARETASPTSASATPVREPAPTPEGTTGDGADDGTARAALERLPVKGRAPKTGYDRALFGPSWTDVDRNGCDTRNDILRRDLAEVVVKAGTGGCKVLRGILHGPYTGTTIRFVAGKDTSADVQIDHVVSLSDAWQKGAQQLTASDRERFANDPMNLLAVDGPTNQSKSDADAATWLPPAQSGWCPLVARQVAVKARYGLWVTAPERDAMRRVLSACPDEPLPGDSAPGAAAATEAPPAPTPAPSSMEAVPGPAPSSGKAAPPPVEDVHFQNCAAARAAGAAPLHRGEPGYRPQMDGDDDGVACESRR